MFYLLLCILSSTLVLITFKLLQQFSVNSFSAIIVNYISASFAGFFLATNPIVSIKTFENYHLLLMLGMGGLFILMFNLLGRSTQTAGVAITSVAAKLSVIIPIMVSVLIDPNDSLNPLRILGILLALVSVVLLILPRTNGKTDIRKIYLPLTIFIGIGLVDSLVKIAQQTFVNNQVNPVFNALVFSMAGVLGLAILPFNINATRDLAKFKTWILGAVLGLANFGSMYFMVAALNHVGQNGKAMQGSILFGINNIGVVLAGALAGLIFFGERPTKVNMAGIGISILAIAVLMSS